MGLRISTNCGSCGCDGESKPAVPVSWQPISPTKTATLSQEMDTTADTLDDATARLTVNQRIIMGIHLGKNSQHEKSKAQFEEALAIINDVTGGDSKRQMEFADALGQIYENLGMLAYETEDLDESEAMLHQALQLYMEAQRDASSPKKKEYVTRNANEVGKALLEIQALKQERAAAAAASAAAAATAAAAASAPTSPSAAPPSPTGAPETWAPATSETRDQAALLSMNSPGASEESIHEEFDKFDLNGDHMLDVGEFTAYLTSVFQRLKEQKPRMFKDHSPADMASETAGLCFKEADLNNDGVLTFYEFKEWLQPKTVTVSPAKAAREQAASVAPISGEAAWRLEAAEAAAAAAAAAEAGALQQKLKEAEANELTVAPTGAIDEQHARQVFDKYDANGDGVFDLGEFTEYLTSVFEALQPHHKAAFRMRALSPRDMAQATAMQCFEEADRNHDGSLSFEEFKAWYSSSSLGAKGSGKPVAEVEGWREKAAAAAAAAADAASSNTAHNGEDLTSEDIAPLSQV